MKSLFFVLFLFPVLVQAQSITVQDANYEFEVYFDNNNNLKVNLLSQLDDGLIFNSKIKKDLNNVYKITYEISRSEEYSYFSHISEDYIKSTRLFVIEKGIFSLYYDYITLAKVIFDDQVLVNNNPFRLIFTDDNKIKLFSNSSNITNIIATIDDENQSINISYTEEFSEKNGSIVVKGIGDVPMQVDTYSRKKENKYFNNNDLWNLLYESQARRFGR